MIRAQDYQFFLKSMKKSENQGLSDVFRVYRKGTLAHNGLTREVILLHQVI